MLAFAAVLTAGFGLGGTAHAQDVTEGVGATPSSTPTRCPPGYPGYPGYPGPPQYPDGAGYPGYPDDPGSPAYPADGCAPGSAVGPAGAVGTTAPPLAADPPAENAPFEDAPFGDSFDLGQTDPAPADCRIRAPKRSSAPLRRNGRFTPRRVVARNPSSATAPCTAVIRARRHRGLAIRDVRFTIPPGRTSKVRLRVRGGAGAVLAAHGRRIVLRIAVQGDSLNVQRRKVRVRLRIPPRRARVRHGPPDAGTGRTPAPTRFSDAPAPTRPPGPPPVVGISDQEPATFTDPLFGAIGARTARLVVPWDEARDGTGEVDAWLDAARAARLEPLVALAAARGDRCPAPPCQAPSEAEYGAAVQQLRSRNPQLRLITPWNEPNHASQPTAASPLLAAGYYNAARAACPSCTLVAGDVLDAPGFMDWVASYREGLVEEPAVWGLHNYHDTTYLQSDGVEALLAGVPGAVWLTETGGIVFHRRADGRIGQPEDEERAAASAALAIRLTAAYRDRVRRVYVYQWRARRGAGFDAGLLRPDGTPRPAYPALLSALADMREEAVAPAAAGAPLVVVAAPVTRSADAVRLGLECLSEAACAGQVSVEDAAWRSAALVNGAAETGLVAPRSMAFTLDAGAQGAISVPLAPGGPVRLRVRVSWPGAGSEHLTTVGAAPG